MAAREKVSAEEGEALTAVFAALAVSEAAGAAATERRAALEAARAAAEEAARKAAEAAAAADAMQVAAVASCMSELDDGSDCRSGPLRPPLPPPQSVVLS